MPEPTDGGVETEVKAEGSKRIDTIRNHWAVRVAAVLLLPIVSSLAAYKGADGKAVYAKDAAEVGFQDTLKRDDKLERTIATLLVTVAELRVEVDELKRRPRVILSKKAKAALPPAPVLVVPQAPIAILPEGPKNLDEALALEERRKQEQKKAAEAPQAPATPK